MKKEEPNVTPNPRSGPAVMEAENKRRKTFGLMLSSPLGKQLMTELEREFDGDDMVGKNPEETYFNLGARHVYRVLRTLRDDAQKE